jgi:hypothetical protein
VVSLLPGHLTRGIVEAIGQSAGNGENENASTHKTRPMTILCAVISLTNPVLTPISKARMIPFTVNGL